MNPLQIFEKHPTADAYRVGGFYSPYALVSQDKRFSDAELAAEYWRKNGDFESCAEGYSVANDGYSYEWEHVEAARLSIIRRFATIPHFDE